MKGKFAVVRVEYKENNAQVVSVCGVTGRSFKPEIGLWPFIAGTWTPIDWDFFADSEAGSLLSGARPLDAEKVLAFGMQSGLPWETECWLVATKHVRGHEAEATSGIRVAASSQMMRQINPKLKIASMTREALESLVANVYDKMNLRSNMLEAYLSDEVELDEDVLGEIVQVMDEAGLGAPIHAFEELDTLIEEFWLDNEEWSRKDHLLQEILAQFSEIGVAYPMMPMPDDPERRRLWYLATCEELMKVFERAAGAYYFKSARGVPDDDESRGQYAVNVDINIFDDEGNIVDGATHAIPIGGVSIIVDHAAQAILQRRKGDSAALDAVLDGLDGALVEHDVIGAV